jgi:UTP-glucose-1-phosphate uridylyltransferase
MIAAMDVALEHTKRYGIVDPGRDDGTLVEVRGLIEKPDPAKTPSRIAVIGRYLLEPAVFAHLGKQQRGAGGEIQLTDGLAALLGGSPFHGYRFAGTRFDCGDKLGWLEANLAFALKRADLGAGVRALLKSYA